MKRPQLITIIIALVLVAGIYKFGKTLPAKKKATASATNPAKHDHAELSIDTFLVLGKKNLSPEQVVRINTLENSISRGNVKDQQLHVYHQLARFWRDSARAFEPYAWYEAEAARLVDSEKSLTFAAHLFLDNLQNDQVHETREWKALQAKDLFERSLRINPNNDSAKIGLGACYMFGQISETPMEGIKLIKEVADKDSTNIYAQMMMAQGSLISGQYDKAISRLQTVNRLQPDNIEAILMLADLYERMGDKINAVTWYRKSLKFIKRPGLAEEINKRIAELSK